MSGSSSGERSSGSKSRIAPAQIHLNANNEAVLIRVLDASFNTVAQGSGSLQMDLPAGIYQVRYQAGPLVTQKLARLRSGEIFTDTVELSVPSPTPLVGSEADLPGAREAVSRLASTPSVASAGSGEFMLFLRRVGDRATPIDRATLTPFSLHDERGARVCNFDTGIEEDPQAMSWVVASMRLNPGGYALRYVAPPEKPGGEPHPVDQSLWIADGWRTIIFIPCRSHGAEPGLASIHMGRSSDPPPGSDPEGSRIAVALETVLASLRRGQRAFYRSHLNLLLSEKHKNPMLGIVGAHAILLTVTCEWDLFDEVVQNLESLLPNHPDVVALRWMGVHHRWMKQFREATPEDPPPPPPGLTSTPGVVLAWPPMMAAGYRSVLQCDAMWPELDLIKPDSVCERAAARNLFLGLWTTWLPLDSSAARISYRTKVMAQRNFVVDQASKLVQWTMDCLGKGTARRHWQSFIEATSGDSDVDPAMNRVQHYLGELVEASDARNAHDFVEQLDVRQVSRAVGLPLRTVNVIRDQLLTSLDRFEKS